MNYPDIFSSIMASSKEDPLVKYRYTFEGASPADVATIAQARAFAAILSKEIAADGRIIPAPILIAGEGVPAFDTAGKPTVVTGQLKFHKVSDMLADGFPEHQACRLFYLFEYGPAAKEDEDQPALGVTSRTQSKVVEVADNIRNWFRGNRDGVWLDISQ